MKNFEKTIYLPVELKNREMKSKLLLASFFLHNGWDVVIGEHGQVRDYAMSQKGGVYIEKDMLYIRAKVLNHMKRNGFLVYAWDEEGLVTGEYERYVAGRLDKSCLEKLDGIIAWGKQQADHIRRFMPEVSDRVYEYGNPRLDLLRKENKGIYMRQIQKIRSAYGVFSLVNLSFPYATDKNTLPRTLEVIKTHIKDATSTRAAVLRKANFDRSMYRSIKAVVKYMSDKMNRTVVIRPHPVDNAETVLHDFQNSHLIHVVQKYDTNAWILSADQLICNTCTTAIEARIAKTPVIVYQLDDIALFSDEIANNIGKKVRNKQELLSALSIMNRKKYVPEKKDEELISTIASIDSKESCCEKILRLVENESAAAGKPVTRKTSFRVKSFAEILRYTVRLIRKPNSKYAIDTYFGMRRNIVDTYQTVYKKASGNELQIECMDGNLFHVRRKVNASR